MWDQSLDIFSFGATPGSKGGENHAVEKSGQTVWDPWAEAMEIMMGEECLTGMKVKDNL